MACNCKFDVPLEKEQRGPVDPIKHSFALHFQNSQVILKGNLFLPEVMDGNKGDDETNEGNRTERQY